MEITTVTIYPFEQGESDQPGTHILAYADIVIDNQLLIKGFRIYRTKTGGLFVSYPAQKNRQGKYFDQVIPQTKETAALIRNQVLDAFQNYAGPCD